MISPQAAWLSPLRRASLSDRVAGIAALGTVAFTTVMLYLEARHEPYHIDELRQVRPYRRTLQEQIDASFAQEQPPLDVIVAARFQSVLGIGDVNQRGSSMLAGLGVVLLLGALLWRHRLRFGVPVAIFALSVTSAWLSYTAYARPYALPTFLILLHLASTDRWLNARSWVGAVLLAATAFLLPLSRVFEPPAYLVLVTLTVFLYRWRCCPMWARRPWYVAGTTVAALVIVELPVYNRLQEQLSAYQGDGGVASLSEQWTRIIDDSIPRLAGVFENGWVALLLIIFALAQPGVRRRLADLWWFWPLLATAGSFAIAFHYRTQPGQPFFDRYGYFWLIPFVVVISVLIEDLLERRKDDRGVVLAGGSIMCVMLALLAAGTLDDLRKEDNENYRPLGEVIEASHPPERSVIFDSTSLNIGAYRPGYAAWGRYTAPSRNMIKAETIPGRPEVIVDEREYLFATNGPVLEIEGWESISATDTMTLYVPEQYPTTAVETAATMISFGEALEPRRGAVLRIAGVAVLLHHDLIEAGCREITNMLDEDADLVGKLASALASSPANERLADCPRGNPLA